MHVYHWCSATRILLVSHRFGTRLQGIDRFRTTFAHCYRDSNASEKYLHTVTGMRRALRNICTPLQGTGGVPTSPSRSKHEEGEVEVDVRVDVMAEL